MAEYNALHTRMIVWILGGLVHNDVGGRTGDMCMNQMLSGCVSKCADDREMNRLLTDHISMLDGWMHLWLTEGLQVDGWPRHLCLIPMPNNYIASTLTF
jgi:hypothetical protein